MVGQRPAGPAVTFTSEAYRCGGTTKAGDRCRQPGPRCRHHPDPNAPTATVPGQAQDWTRLMALPVEPACWSWPLPDRLPDGRLGITLAEWHDGRCAMCGIGGGGNVCDHDHRTAMVRGYLCHSCNTREGMDRGQSAAWENYRLRPPATILGVEVQYISLVTGPAVPDPPPPTMDQLWKDHPFRGVL